MWASNCEYLLDYLEQKQSRLPPHDFSLEYAYKTVRLQVERGDARENERVKALRIMFVELGDGEFADCPIDLRQWLRSTQMDQKERLDREREHEKQRLQQQQQHQLLLQMKKQKQKERAAHFASGRAEQQEEEASPAGVRSEAGTKLIGENVEQKLDGSLAMAGAVVGTAGGSSAASSASPADNMLLESPMHSEGTSDTDEMMNASDLFAISADSITLASQLASAKKLSAAQRRRTNKGGKGRGAHHSSSAAISAWADPSDSALGAVAAAGALTGADALERPPSRKAHERKRISGRRHRHHRHRRGGSGTVAVPHAATTTSVSVSPSSSVDGPPSANPSRTDSGSEFKRRDSGAFLLRTGGGSTHHRSGENKLSDTATANSSSSLGVEFLPSQARVRGRAESKSAAHMRQVRRGSYKLLHPLGVEDAFVGAPGTGVGAGVGVGAAAGAGGGGGGGDDGDGGGEAYVKRRPSQIQIPSSPTPARPRKMTIDASNRQTGGGRRKLTIDGSRRRASIERRGSLGLLTRRLSNESVGSSPDAASTAHASPSVLMRHAVGGGGVDGGGSGSGSGSGSGGDSAANHGAPGRLVRPSAASRSGRRRSSSAPGISSGSPRIVWQADPAATSGGGGGSVGGDAMSATPEAALGSSSSSSSSSSSTSRFAPSPRVRKASISGAHRMPKTHHRRRRESSAERALQVVESALYANATQQHHHPRRRPSFGAAPPTLEAKSAGGAVRFRGK